MKSEVKDISPSQKEIHLEIDAEVVKASYAKVSQKYASRANVPGFRKGYAPLDVIRMRFKEEIKSDVLQEVIPGQVAAAIESHDLHPLAEPHLHLDDHETVKVNGSEPLKLHVHVEVMPEIAEPKFDGIEVTRSVKPVADDEIESLINERLQREAALIPVEGRASEIGDTVNVDLVGTFEGDADGQPITAEGIEIELGSEAVERSFSDNLIGVSEDEEKEFTVEYSADFTSEALAGKTVHYKAKVNSIGKTEIPEANDEWAQSLDEDYKSLKDLRTRLRADMEKTAEADADARVRNEAVAKMIEANSFEVPSSFIENQARNLLNNFAHDMQQRGTNLEQLDEKFIQMIYGNMRQQAERDVAGALLLDKVAEIAKVEVSDAEVEEELAKMAEYYRSSVDEIKQSLEKQGGSDSIKNNLKTRKSVEAVIGKVKVVEGKWQDPDEVSAAMANAAESSTEEKPKKAAKKPAAKKAAKKD
ncbi:MAG TPA: trigger factor [Pyrinomonadaceae bacterium]|nr:trigger factor [Pyrinomonadaceae bacterium]